MKCPKCNGLIVILTEYSVYGKAKVYKCLNCGYRYYLESGIGAL
jgi:predicted RNA-binding Zn-ribbon protein involved in translation (DUF1610 family)